MTYGSIKYSSFRSSLPKWASLIKCFIFFLLVIFIWQDLSWAGGSVRVRGYYRKDGTYVRPHYRSRPDGNIYNNWSTKGNYNPYTGKKGTKIPYGLPSRNYFKSTPSYSLGNGREKTKTEFSNALTEQKNRNYSKAEKLWIRFLEKHPNSYQARNNLGQAYYNQNKLLDSIRELAIAYKLKPSNKKIKNNYRQALKLNIYRLTESGQFKKAKESLIILETLSRKNDGFVNSKKRSIEKNLFQIGNSQNKFVFNKIPKIEEFTFKNEDDLPLSPTKSISKNEIKLKTLNEIDQSPEVFPESESLKNYALEIQSKVLQQWQDPVGGVEGEVKLSFSVLSNGKIKNIQIIQGSEIYQLEKLAIQAIENANPLASIPKEIQKDLLEVEINFRYRIKQQSSQKTNNIS